MALVEQMMASAKLQMKSAESQVTSSNKELDDAQEYLKKWVICCIYDFDVVFSYNIHA